MSVISELHDAPDGRRRRLPARVLRLASDERLVEMLRGGSESAFEALFDRHHRGVLGFCRHMLGSVEEAEDAVQHTFLAAYRELVGSNKPIQLRPWLYTIARNRCLTALRSRSRQADGELREPPTEHLAAEVERRHDLRALLGDVARLPDEQRAALVLSELGDMPHDEIAAVLGCRREKVKALVFQARSSLIASRAARETSCADIRELVANLTGGSLRRNEVRRHLAECAGCREFRQQVRRQRRELAVVLPVAPTVGLKAAVLGGATSGAVATKLLVVAAIVGGGAAALEVKSVVDRPAPERHAAPAPAKPHVVQTSAAAQPAASAVPLTTRRPAATKPAPGRHTAFAPSKPKHAKRHAAKPAEVAKTHGPHAGAPATLSPRAHPVHPAHPAHPAHPVHPANAAKPTKAPKPLKAVGKTKAPKPEKAAKAPKPLKPKPAKAPKPIATLKPEKAEKPDKKS